MDTEVRAAGDAALTQVLREVMAESGDAPITCGDLVRRFGERSHEMLLVFFAFPLALPVPIPALSTLFGAAATCVAFYFAVGKPPWLPARIANRPIRPDSLRRACGRLLRLLEKTERLIHPRWVALTHGPRRTRFHARVLFVLAFLIVLPLPIPLANTVAAVPMLLIALGLLERDGACVVLGYLAAIPCAAYYGAIAVLGLEGMRQLMGWLV